MPATRQKKKLRWWVSLAFVGALVALFLYGWYILMMMRGLTDRSEEARSGGRSGASRG
ncbi:MAG: hypothetical protein HZY73_09130 [Micropruina sp.]|nr:MAG: hypothetical protein HZY73_09130 [Micropruina sp.]